MIIQGHRKLPIINPHVKINYFNDATARLEKISAGMAEKARGGKFLLVLPYCKKFSAMAFSIRVFINF
jgi:hypothetical protein